MLEGIGRAPELTASAESDDQGKDFKTESDKTLADVGVLADDRLDQELVGLKLFTPYNVYYSA